MKKLVKLIKENHLVGDVWNVLLGLALVVTIVLFFLFPDNKSVIVVMILLSGFMNIGNGFKRYQEETTKMTGAGLMMVGGCILILGVYFMYLL